MRPQQSARRAKLEGEITKGFRGIFIFLFSMSGIINVLALTGSLYMLQVYDRALTGGSIPTLLALSVWPSASISFKACST